MKTEFRYGKKIKELREDRAWTQEQLAQAAGIEPRTVQRVERDQTKSPETLQAIAGAFDVDLIKLRSTWLIPESRLVGTYFADSHKAFVGIEERHRWHAYTHSIMAPLTEQGRKQVEELLDQIFADRDLIEPDERELWKGYIEQIEEPLASLFEMKLAMFIVDERRDLILRVEFSRQKNRISTTGKSSTSLSFLCTDVSEQILLLLSTVLMRIASLRAMSFSTLYNETTDCTSSPTLS